MMLSALIRKRRNATATPATPATHKGAKVGTVAKVASVAVANLQERLRYGNWSDGPDAPWTDQRQRFCVHLFGCTDCSHPENIHCPTGARLLAAYRDTLAIHQPARRSTP